MKRPLVQELLFAREDLIRNGLYSNYFSSRPTDLRNFILNKVMEEIDAKIIKISLCHDTVRHYYHLWSNTNKASIRQIYPSQVRLRQRESKVVTGKSSKMFGNRRKKKR